MLMMQTNASARARRVSGSKSEVIDVSAKTCQHAEKKAREGVNEAVAEARERERERERVNS